MLSKLNGGVLMSLDDAMDYEVKKSEKSLADAKQEAKQREIEEKLKEEQNG